MINPEHTPKIDSLPETLPDGALDLVARRFAVLGEPMRLKILKSLMSGEHNVSALVEETGGQQANVSRHLQTLAINGLVKRRKEGLQVIYSVADPSIFKLCELVCGSVGTHLRQQSNSFQE